MAADPADPDIAFRHRNCRVLANPTPLPLIHPGSLSLARTPHIAAPQASYLSASGVLRDAVVLLSRVEEAGQP